MPLLTLGSEILLFIGECSPLASGWLEAKAASEGLADRGRPMFVELVDRDTCGPRSPPSGTKLRWSAGLSLVGTRWASEDVVVEGEIILLFKTCVAGAKPP